jgi:hypothetical protein
MQENHVRTDGFFEDVEAPRRQSLGPRRMPEERMITLVQIGLLFINVSPGIQPF